MLHAMAYSTSAIIAPRDPWVEESFWEQGWASSSATLEQFEIIMTSKSCHATLHCAVMQHFLFVCFVFRSSMITADLSC